METCDVCCACQIMLRVDVGNVVGLYESSFELGIVKRIVV